MTAEGEDVLKQLWTLFNSYGNDSDESKSLLRNVKLLGCLLVQYPPKDEDSDKRLRIFPGTLLHYAAAQNDSSILCAVLTLYQRKSCLSPALLTRNSHQQTPLMAAVSVYEPSITNVLVLCRSCRERAPGAFIMTDKSGRTLFHRLLCWDPPSSQVVSITKFLLNQDICQSLLLQKAEMYRGELTPVELAKHMQSVTKSGIEMDARSKRAVPDSKRESLQVYTDLKNMLELATAEKQVDVIFKISSIEEEQRRKEKNEEISLLIKQHVEAENWHIAIKFIFVEDEEAALMALNHIVDQLLSNEGKINVALPLDDTTVKRLVVLMKWSSSTHDLSYVSWYLSFALRDKSTHHFVWKEDNILANVLSNLRLPDANLQSASIEVLKCLSESGEAQDTSEWIQPLNVVKEFSSSSHARRIAGNLLSALNVDQPLNPSHWSVDDVCNWMLNQKHLDHCESYASLLKAQQVDGLRLMELSSRDFASMGIKNVTEQQAIIDVIDYLRVLNKKAATGKRDIFLSYSHASLAIAKQIKDSLNAADYSVWIDEAGIRPGHKWRNEIADGIENSSCLLFVMTERAAQSVYCIDELGLAEDMKKPIFTVECEPAKSIDPGLRLIIMSRQWIQCVGNHQIEEKVGEIIAALKSNGIHPTGADAETKERSFMIHSHSKTHTLPSSTASQPAPLASSHLADLTEEVDKWHSGVELLLQGLDKRLSHLESRIKEVANKDS